MQGIHKRLNRLPRPLVRWLRNRYLAALDLRDRLRGDRDDLVPPRSLHFVGGGDFRAIGRAYFDHFVKIGGLKPHDAVLDIGCGTGRMAVPMLGYLQTSYLGFDISKDAVRWCREHISARDARFQFQFADIYNLEYNPGGGVAAHEYQFPCETASVDFAFATSVFTHLLPRDARRYLSEVGRCLRPNGRALLTFFIADEVALDAVRRGTAAMDFSDTLDDCLVVDKKTPERAVAFEPAVLKRMVADAGLEIREPILWGSWSGRASLLDVQDALILTKR